MTDSITANSNGSQLLIRLQRETCCEETVQTASYTVLHCSGGPASAWHCTYTLGAEDIAIRKSVYSPHHAQIQHILVRLVYTEPLLPQNSTSPVFQHYSAVHRHDKLPDLGSLLTNDVKATRETVQFLFIADHLEDLSLFGKLPFQVSWIPTLSMLRCRSRREVRREDWKRCDDTVLGILGSWHISIENTVQCRVYLGSIQCQV